MKNFWMLGLLAFFGCTSGDKDTGDSASTETDADTDADTDTDVDFDFTSGLATGAGFAADCADNLCIYRMETTRAASSFELDITETGDTASSSPWHEAHDAFALETANTDGSETYRLDLTWVTDYTQQVANSTTLLNPDVLTSYSPWSAGLTWYFSATDSAGTTVCVVTGHDPAYYSEWCTNVVN